MEKKFPISKVIKKFRCCLCDCILSIPPIRFTGSNLDQYRCGRCESVFIRYNFKDSLFENVAQHISFPCTFDQCKKRLAWGTVGAHEKNCPHRTMRCPLHNEICSQQIRLDRLLNHFKDKHPTNVNMIQLTWELKIEDYVFLIEFSKQYFLVYILQHKGTFSIAVLALQHTKFSKFNVKLIASTRAKFEVHFADLPIFRYDEKSHCYECAREKCTAVHHPYSNEHSEKIDLRTFTSTLDKDLCNSVISPAENIRYNITIQGDGSNSEHCVESGEEEDEEVEKIENKEEEAAAAITHPLDTKITEAAKRALTCPYCITYMVSPIFTCLIGHTICNVCKTRVEKCPLCAEPLRSFRNYKLEEIAKYAKLPCPYDSEGCSFMSNICDMSSHERTCRFRME